MAKNFNTKFGLSLLYSNKISLFAVGGKLICLKLKTLKCIATMRGLCTRVWTCMYLHVFLLCFYFLGLLVVLDHRFKHAQTRRKGEELLPLILTFFLSVP